jgi:hypothetical protein
LNFVTSSRSWQVVHARSSTFLPGHRGDHRRARRRRAVDDDAMAAASATQAASSAPAPVEGRRSQLDDDLAEVAAVVHQLERLRRLFERETPCR